VIGDGGGGGGERKGFSAVEEKRVFTKSTYTDQEDRPTTIKPNPKVKKKGKKTHEQ